MIPFKNVLIFSPHTDDAELGCGGTISMMRRNNINVSVVIFSDAKISQPEGYSLKNECESSLMELDVNSFSIYGFETRSFRKKSDEISKLIYEKYNEMKPDLVICPCSSDKHPDHHVVYRETVRICRTSIIGFELQHNHSNIENPLFIKLENIDIMNKIKSLSLYKSQVQVLKRPYFETSIIKGSAEIRGIQCDVKVAEMFQAINIII